jgi:hypothetical protein
VRFLANIIISTALYDQHTHISSFSFSDCLAATSAIDAYPHCLAIRALHAMQVASVLTSNGMALRATMSTL